MKEVYIVGASGFGREVAWLIEELDGYKVKGFIDDNELVQAQVINGIPVAGTVDFLLQKKEETSVVIAIGNPAIRMKIYNTLKDNPNLNFPNIIAKDVRISKYIDLGIGNIICSGSILTTNIKIGDFNHINLSCTVGHDVIINNFVTVYPSVNISGNVVIGDFTELGTGSQIIQGKNITNNVVIGAGSVVIRNIGESGTYVGTPVKRVK